MPRNETPTSCSWMTPHPDAWGVVCVCTSQTDGMWWGEEKCNCKCCSELHSDYLWDDWHKVVLRGVIRFFLEHSELWKVQGDFKFLTAKYINVLHFEYTRRAHWEQSAHACSDGMWCVQVWPLSSPFYAPCLKGKWLHFNFPLVKKLILLSHATA